MSDLPELPRRRFTSIFSMAMCAIVSAIYWLQPDQLAALTLVPTWFWFIPAGLLSILGLKQANRRWLLATAILWSVFLFTFVEETYSLLPWNGWTTNEWRRARQEGRGARIVTLNCAGSARALAEIAKFDPDIVLIQESPRYPDVARWADKLFGQDEGTFLRGTDTSILVRGQLERQFLKSGERHFVHAKVKLLSGFEVDVVSLRLEPPVFRHDFWTLGFWQAHREKRQQHREQLDVIVGHLGTLDDQHVIIGGDFNAPPYDGATSPLREDYTDAFRAAGRGWGNTATNDYPLFRVDQVWLSRGLNSQAVTVQSTIDSDHRMVICDVMISEN